MSKIKIETFKKLFSVKKGGAEFFRLVIKFTFWIFILGAIFSVIYSLNELVKIESAKFAVANRASMLEDIKVQRNCDASARIALSNAMAQAKKDKKEVKKEDQERFLKNTFAECLYLNGYDVPTAQTAQTEKKEIKK